MLIFIFFIVLQLCINTINCVPFQIEEITHTPVNKLRNRDIYDITEAEHLNAKTSAIPPSVGISEADFSKHFNTLQRPMAEVLPVQPNANVSEVTVNNVPATDKPVPVKIQLPSTKPQVTAETDNSNDSQVSVSKKPDVEKLMPSEGKIKENVIKVDSSQENASHNSITSQSIANTSIPNIQTTTIKLNTTTTTTVKLNTTTTTITIKHTNSAKLNNAESYVEAVPHKETSATTSLTDPGYSTNLSTSSELNSQSATTDALKQSKSLIIFAIIVPLLLIFIFAAFVVRKKNIILNMKIKYHEKAIRNAYYK
ncbi:hypothetical protein HDU92_002268 [Lobulomyces angularis]|nr:hypothetical protein HDU92_002268 [Lobulomyces angularis]